jgi:hypothetical protein
MAVGLGLVGPVLMPCSTVAGDPPKVQTPPKIQPIRVSVSKSTVRSEPKRERYVVNYYDQSGRYMGSGKETSRTGPKEIGKNLSVELRNIGNKAYTNLRVSWTVRFQRNGMFFDSSISKSSKHPPEMRSGSNTVNLPLGGKGDVVTSMVEGEILGYKVEVFDGNSLLAVVSDGL